MPYRIRELKKDIEPLNPRLRVRVEIDGTEYEIDGLRLIETSGGRVIIKSGEKIMTTHTKNTFTVTNDMVNAYAAELLGMTDGISYPRLIAIYKNGSVDSGFYEQNLHSGAWHHDDAIIGTVKIDEPLEWGEGNARDLTAEDVVGMFGDEIERNIYDAVEQE